MLITPENSLIFIVPDIVADNVSGNTQKSYENLIEVRHGIIEAIVDDHLIRTSRGCHYAEFQEAIAKQLVWDTDLNAANIPESIKRWNSILYGPMVKRMTIDQIKKNDLTLPEFQEFNNDLTMFLVSCTRSGDFYIPKGVFDAPIRSA